jgi:hypothetical protein
MFLSASSPPFVPGATKSGLSQKHSKTEVKGKKDPHRQRAGAAMGGLMKDTLYEMAMEVSAEVLREEAAADEEATIFRPAPAPAISHHQRRRRQQQLGEAQFRSSILGKLCKYAPNESRPSCAESEGAWLYCSDTSGRVEPPLDERGSWMLFSPKCMVDSDWLIIKMATARGELGCSAKVSTAMSAHANTKETRIIFVESAAVPAARLPVLDRLRELGWRLDAQFKLRRESVGLMYHMPEAIWARGEIPGGEWWAVNCDKRPLYLYPTDVSADVAQVLQHVIIPFEPAMVAVCKSWADTPFSARRLRIALRKTCPWKCASPVCSFCSPPANFSAFQLRRLYATGELPEDEIEGGRGATGAD